jgi:crotonobetainyl-CoA:carnitine CoA-transferase CaiB-like acyl-CoA transferase
MAFGGIMMALYRREKTGLGDYLDISMHDSLVAWLPNILGTVFVENRAPVPKHERTWGGSGFYRIYRTKDDRYVVLGGQEIKFVRHLLGELGRLDLVALAERGPGPHQRPMVDFLAQTFATRTQAEWIDWFRGRTEVSFAPVKDLREAMDDPHVLARGMVIRDAAGRRHLGVPIRYADEPARPHFTLAGLGEHTDEVLAAAGYDAARIAAMRADGALG